MLGAISMQEDCTTSEALLLVNDVFDRQGVQRVRAGRGGVRRVWAGRKESAMHAQQYAQGNSGFRGSRTHPGGVQTGDHKTKRLHWIAYIPRMVHAYALRVCLGNVARMANQTAK